jgi:hypothetical protein
MPTDFVRGTQQPVPHARWSNGPSHLAGRLGRGRVVRVHQVLIPVVPIVQRLAEDWKMHADGFRIHCCGRRQRGNLAHPFEESRRLLRVTCLA